MPISSEMLERLRAAGYKITPARQAVLQVIEQGHAHLNPTEVLARAKELHPAIGRATVYRTLELLTELGILRPIYSGDNAFSFIRAEGGHHHLVCADCGKIIEFDECIADELSHDLEERFGFRITSHLLEFYGLCEGCNRSAP